LANLLHGYYLLVQWHRDPFNIRNNDASYLHRCGIDDDDDEDDSEEEDYEDECQANERIQLNSKEEKSEVSKTGRVGRDMDLSSIGMTLLRYRKIVWENMQQSVCDMLERIQYLNGMYSPPTSNIIADNRIYYRF